MSGPLESLDPADAGVAQTMRLMVSEDWERALVSWRALLVRLGERDADPSTGPQHKANVQARAECHRQISKCHCQRDEYQEALRSGMLAVQYDGDNSFGFYRVGKAFFLWAEQLARQAAHKGQEEMERLDVQTAYLLDEGHSHFRSALALGNLQSALPQPQPSSGSDLWTHLLDYYKHLGIRFKENGLLRFAQLSFGYLVELHEMRDELHLHEKLTDAMAYDALYQHSECGFLLATPDSICRAYEFANRCLKLSPRLPRTLLLLGRAYKHHVLYRSAVVQFKRGLRRIAVSADGEENREVKKLLEAELAALIDIILHPELDTSRSYGAIPIKAPPQLLLSHSMLSADEQTDPQCLQDAVRQTPVLKAQDLDSFRDEHNFTVKQLAVNQVVSVRMWQEPGLLYFPRLVLTYTRWDELLAVNNKLGASKLSKEVIVKVGLGFNTSRDWSYTKEVLAKFDIGASLAKFGVGLSGAFSRSTTRSNSLKESESANQSYEETTTTTYIIPARSSCFVYQRVNLFTIEVHSCATAELRPDSSVVRFNRHSCVSFTQYLQDFLVGSRRRFTAALSSSASRSPHLHSSNVSDTDSVGSTPGSSNSTSRRHSTSFGSSGYPSPLLMPASSPLGPLSSRHVARGLLHNFNASAAGAMDSALLPARVNMDTTNDAEEKK